MGRLASLSHPPCRRRLRLADAAAGSDGADGHDRATPTVVGTGPDLAETGSRLDSHGTAAAEDMVDGQGLHSPSCDLAEDRVRSKTCPSAQTECPSCC